MGTLAKNDGATRTASIAALGAIAVLAQRALSLGEKEVVTTCGTLASSLIGSHLSTDNIAASWDDVKKSLQELHVKKSLQELRGDDYGDLHGEIVSGIIESAVEEAILHLVELLEDKT